MSEEDDWPAVVRALEATGDDRLRAVGELVTREELHQFALNYNPNDDPTVCAVVADHPGCDRGTALMLLWLFADIVMREASLPPEHPAVQAVSRISKRLEADRFASGDYEFDAAVVLEMNAVQRGRLSSLGLPEQLLRCSGSIPPERVWLS